MTRLGEFLPILTKIKKPGNFGWIALDFETFTAYFGNKIYAIGLSLIGLPELPNIEKISTHLVTLARRSFTILLNVSVSGSDTLWPISVTLTPMILKILASVHRSTDPKRKAQFSFTEEARLSHSQVSHDSHFCTFHSIRNR